MAKYSQVSFPYSDSRCRHVGYHNGWVGYAIMPPQSGTASERAQTVEDKCDGVYEHLRTATTTWQDLGDHYQSEDRGTVLQAMVPILEGLIALKRAGEKFRNAIQTYDRELQGLDAKKTSYDVWVSGWITDWNAHLRDKQSMDDEEYEKKHHKSKIERERDLKDERGREEGGGAIHIETTINSARSTLAQTLKAIDMEELGEIRISSTPEAISTIPTVDALEERIKASHVFSGVEGMDSRADEVAEAVWDDVYQDLPTDYIDSHGTHWVFGPDGEAVRVGSAMDPNLNAAIWDAMNKDPVLSDAAVDMPGTSFGTSKAGGAATWAGGLGANEGTVAGYDRLVNGIDTGSKPASGTVAKGLGKGVAGAPIDVFATGLDVGQQKHAQGVQSPLLSDAEAGDRSSRYATKQVVSTVAGIAGGGTAVVVTGTTGGVGFLVGAGTGVGVSKASDAVMDGTVSKTWSIEELDEAHRQGKIR